MHATKLICRDLLLLNNGGLHAAFRSIPSPTVQNCVTSCHFQSINFLFINLVLLRNSNNAFKVTIP